MDIRQIFDLSNISPYNSITRCLLPIWWKKNATQLDHVPVHHPLSLWRTSLTMHLLSHSTLAPLIGSHPFGPGFHFCLCRGRPRLIKWWKVPWRRCHFQGWCLKRAIYIYIYIKQRACYNACLSSLFVNVCSGFVTGLQDQSSIVFQPSNRRDIVALKVTFMADTLIPGCNIRTALTSKIQRRGEVQGQILCKVMPWKQVMKHTEPH